MYSVSFKTIGSRARLIEFQILQQTDNDMEKVIPSDQPGDSAFDSSFLASAKEIVDSIKSEISEKERAIELLRHEITEDRNRLEKVMNKVKHLDISSSMIVKDDEQSENKEQLSTRNDIGIDLVNQLKRVSIPVFTGDKRTYQSW